MKIWPDSPRTDDRRLVHLVYEATLDSSLWPELILELTNRLTLSRSGAFLPDTDEHALDITEHFRRALQISQSVIGLQKREQRLRQILDTFAAGVALLDRQGQVILANKSMEGILSDLDIPAATAPGFIADTLTKAKLRLPDLVNQCNRSCRALTITAATDKSRELMLLPQVEALRMGFPETAYAVLLSSPRSKNVVQRFSREKALSPRERELVESLVETGDLHQAAVTIGLSYQSARVYIKRIFAKSDLHSQIDLIRSITTSTGSYFYSDIEDGHLSKNIRRVLSLPGGRQLEFFTLGPETGRPLIYFEALSGISIDVLGYPERCLEYLEKYNIRLIVPCRPGCFRSDVYTLESLGEFSHDLAAILDALDVERFSILSVSFGSAMALAMAHTMQDRVDKVVISSGYFQEYIHSNWRELDQLHHLSHELARHWPALFRQVIPFLVRSILQNHDRFFDRYLKSTVCQDDRDMLGNPIVRTRAAKMLALRTARGFEGMLEENLLNARPWGFDVEDITLPVEIYHGDKDSVAPLEGMKLLADRLPNARLHVLKDRGHYQDMRNWPWLAARAVGHDVAPNSDIYVFPDQ